MREFDIEKMLFTIPPEKHGKEEVINLLCQHPEVQFVSFVGIDLGGHDTDEKIPVKTFIQDMDKLLKYGVQTDGSSVALPKIAELGNAKVDIIPDLSVKWYVDYNYRNIDRTVGLPVGTLRIPSFLVHNENFRCGSRSILKNALTHMKKEIFNALKEHSYVFDYIEGIDSVDEIEDLIVTSATEL